MLTRAGAQVVPCRVDAHGVVPEELPGDLRLLYTTPAHQYPLGGRLPVGRRQALTAWARATGAVVVEDDYDSEFRYDVGPLPALYSMDPEVIVYLGTASKALTPAVGAGWLVASPALVERIARLRPDLGERVPEPGAARPAGAAHLWRHGTAHPPDAPGVRPPPGRDRRGADRARARARRARRSEPP